nr:hypothetical protein CFP56_72515 [Quercus suber]
MSSSVQACRSLPLAFDVGQHGCKNPSFLFGDWGGSGRDDHSSHHTVTTVFPARAVKTLLSEMSRPCQCQDPARFTKSAVYLGTPRAHTARSPLLGSRLVADDESASTIGMTTHLYLNCSTNQVQITARYGFSAVECISIWLSTRGLACAISLAGGMRRSGTYNTTTLVGKSWKPIDRSSEDRAPHESNRRRVLRDNPVYFRIETRTFQTDKKKFSKCGAINGERAKLRYRPTLSFPVLGRVKPEIPAPWHLSCSGSGYLIRRAREAFIAIEAGVAGSPQGGGSSTHPRRTRQAHSPCCIWSTTSLCNERRLYQ